ncbi:MAG: hypothetical protein IIA23_06130 [Chloroflexi bacterium]|nr:hypothetical protein [Chloroflexota bacterium]
MTRQTLPQSTDHYPQTADEPWQAFFFARELGAEITVATSLNACTTDQLLDEALLRSRGDAPALRLMHLRTLEALLAARDRELPNDRA